MESLAVFVDEEWNNLSRMFSSEEYHYSIDQPHGHGLFPINIETPSTFWSTDHESSNATAPVFMFDERLFLNHPFSQEPRNSSGTSATTNLSLPTSNYENYHNYSEQLSMDICRMDYNNNNFSSHVFSDDVMEEILCLKRASENHLDDQQMSDNPGREMYMPHKRNFKMPELPQAPEDEVVQIDQFDKNPKKKQRILRKNNKNKKSAQSKKNQKTGTDTNGSYGELATTNNGGNVNGQNLTSCCSEDDSNSNGAQESNGEGALNSNGKTRAGRGAATDPQSLYARKRRERINERLRILQNLVPNGTKVDTCTMLEEAVHYVKFLQLQIKLLNSDDMWMYAPIVYNGMDMGLFQKITSLAR